MGIPRSNVHVSYVLVLVCAGYQTIKEVQIDYFFSPIILSIPLFLL